MTLNRRMDLDGQQYQAALASLPPSTFECRFAKTVTALGLDGVFDRNELKLLCEASDKALACNVALNGIGLPEQRVLPQDERQRSRAEQEFMLARDLFYASPGWQNLDAQARKRVEESLMNVGVLDDHLAW